MPPFQAYLMLFQCPMPVRHYVGRLERTMNPASLRSSRNLELYQIVVGKPPNQDGLQF